MLLKRAASPLQSDAWWEIKSWLSLHLCYCIWTRMVNKVAACVICHQVVVYIRGSVHPSVCLCWGRGVCVYVCVCVCVCLCVCVYVRACVCVKEVALYATGIILCCTCSAASSSTTLTHCSHTLLTMTQNNSYCGFIYYALGWFNILQVHTVHDYAAISLIRGKHCWDSRVEASVASLPWGWGGGGGRGCYWSLLCCCGDGIGCWCREGGAGREGGWEGNVERGKPTGREK